MRVLSNRVIYSDGKHNAFTSMVAWRGRYWVAFRNGASHSSHDGRVLIISSADLTHWSAPLVAIDTAADDRDPKLVVFQDRLFVAAFSSARTYADEQRLGGLVRFTSLHTTMTSSADGTLWQAPWVATEPFHFIWGMRQRDGRLYASERKSHKTIINGLQHSDCYSAFLRSDDGRRWQRLSLISTERLSSEAAFDVLPDGQAVAFVRHDLDNYPEIKVAQPPYTVWQTIVAFPFRCQGPSLDRIQDSIVLSGRVFFDDTATPLLTPDLVARGRGLLLMTLDLAGRRLVPQTLIPHSTGPLAPGDPRASADARFNEPDISYASAVDLGGGEFAMSYYDGYTGRPADIRMLRMSMD